MSHNDERQDEIKRKLRELKKLEIKIRSHNYTTEFNSKFSPSTKNIDLVWNIFFDVKEETTNKVKYSIQQLLFMNKDEFKDVINEYLSYVYYYCYKEQGIIVDHTSFDLETITQLGLPIYADYNEIKRKFRELAQLYHPDNGGDGAKFIEFMEKYRNIKN